MTLLLSALVVAPGCTFLGLALYWLLQETPPERIVARLTSAVSGLVCAGAAMLGYGLWQTGASRIDTPTLPWLHVGRYHLDLALSLDRLSWPLVMLTSVLVGLVGVFSVRYVHRDRGFFRFFLMLHLFEAGAMLTLTAASLDLLVCGWEIVGLTSVLLIAFFQERPDPVRNALRVFAFYRAADVGLLAGVFVMHHTVGTTALSGLAHGAWPLQDTALAPGAAGVIGALLLVAASGKSAQGPFSGWLPRAMEGPTPSSAIFYGAISVHLGAYLLLRIQPLMAAAPWVAAVTVAIGGVTAVLATVVHRTSADAKTSLAYASMAQLGVIFVEIGFGYPRLAVAHIVGHATVRTLQFLRAPSMLHDHHRVHAAAGGHLPPTGAHLDRIVPTPLQAWLYRAGIEQGYHEAIVERVFLAPLIGLARWFESLESFERRDA